jgi:hypothetical protein
MVTGASVIGPKCLWKKMTSNFYVEIILKNNKSYKFSQNFYLRASDLALRSAPRLATAA